jgi:hypothetical protein
MGLLLAQGLVRPSLSLQTQTDAPTPDGALKVLVVIALETRRGLTRQPERWEPPANSLFVLSARKYCAQRTGLSRLNHNILRLSCRAIAISCFYCRIRLRVDAMNSSASADRYPSAGFARRRSEQCEKRRWEGAAFQRLPRVHRQGNSRGMPHHFRYGAGKLSICPLYRAGGVPRRAMSRRGGKLPDFCRIQLVQIVSSCGWRREQYESRSKVVAGYTPGRFYLPKSSAASVAALSASVAAKMRFFSLRACSACSLKRFDCSYCARLSVLRRE